MYPLLDAFSWLVVVVLLLPLAVILVETWAALLPQKREVAFPISAGRPPCAILLPAHDEEAGLGRTIQTLLPQLAPGDRLVVIADNCTDQTAAVARSFGVTVLERNDPSRRGKGFALDHGIRWLEKSPPEVVVIVDADCVVEDGALDQLVGKAAATGLPIQSANLMDLPPRPGHRDRVSAFAFLYKNMIRPLGLRRLGLPCLLSTGAAFPWPQLQGAVLAHGNIVEDRQLGIDLAVAGWPPQFCPQARIHSELPSGQKASTTQRTRWEHGHIRTLIRQVPRLLAAAFRQRRLNLLGLALELLVPPLALLFLLWGTILAVLVGVLWAGGSAWPALVFGAAGGAVLLSILTAWARFGRELLPLRSLLAVPFYVAWKMPIYIAFLLRPQGAWIRTERPSAPPEGEIKLG
jgi:cellulose synthase/poly-beta-1,6-N-acetylglucosamine synthase-like glycosyltransferase